MSQERLEFGLEVFAKMMGEDKAAAVKESLKSDGFASGMSRLGMINAFAEAWGRDGLDFKQRSLVTISILIATRSEKELKNHIRIGVRNGLTTRELEEILFQALPYLGFSVVPWATTVMLETLRELGLDTQTKTSEERGLL
jgi:4-carboxymuconolactone decarboxylase